MKKERADARKQRRPRCQNPNRWPTFEPSSGDVDRGRSAFTFYHSPAPWGAAMQRACMAAMRVRDARNGEGRERR